MSVLSILSLAGFLLLIAHLLRSRFALFVAGFFTIFPLIYRAIDVTALDVFGPFYTRELNQFIGGNGAAPVFIYAALAFIVPLMLVFPDRGKGFARLAALRPAYSNYHELAGHGAFVLGTGVLGLLAVNFILTGTVPILQGIDRIAYSQSAGAIHITAYELNFLLNFLFGAFTILPRINGRGFDMRFAFLAAALAAYWVITGNRFSVFFVLVSFYLMPVALVYLARKAGRIGELEPGMLGQRIITSRPVRIMAVFASVFMVAGLLYNSYYNVRDYRDPVYEISERVLVQPVQLWVNSWDRVDFGNTSDPINDHAIGEVLDPIDFERNSTIQYLMTKELGYFRAAELTELGQAYNGGYPEVHFELLGAYLPFLTLPLAGLIASLFLSLFLRLLYRNLVMTSVLGLYVYFGITLHFTGGMLTFVLTETYWIKIALFLACWAVEGHIVARGDRIAFAAAWQSVHAGERRQPV
ncbi:DUF6418 domain-containing protein [uncultured Erythrobacter sp.]|uniref:DUF6418 domain-containing protein n=1 Tax=uncultured Erythrobacter sp. TaxID=263913 RepID=UPI002626FFB0|nr:DUF6418 domain-containing protein [uncultured Erythrobacter sp.]